MKELSQKRAVCAMPMAGSYRSIDFTLSNMSNSHIQKVAVFTQYNSRSLNEHLSSSKWWDFGRKQGGLYVFTPAVTAENSNWYRGTADAIYQNLTFLKNSHEPYVVISSGDCIYKMDFNAVLEYHIDKKADITVVCRDMEPGTEIEVPRGEIGEIVISGPTVMRCYLNEPEETAETLRVHADGKTWLYTGDLAVMDDEDFIFFKGRSKRMIISAGYNVYPAQVEAVLDAHEAVRQSCIIGVPDQVKGEKVKAFAVLKDGYEGTKELNNEIKEYLRGKLSKFAMPYNIEFRTELPKTKMNKVDYRALMKEEEDKLAAKQARKEALKKQRAEAEGEAGEKTEKAEATE